MNKGVKESLRRSQHWTMGPPYGTEVGLEWHALMENFVKEVLTKTSNELYEKGMQAFLYSANCTMKWKYLLFPVSSLCMAICITIKNYRHIFRLQEPMISIDYVCLFVCFFAFSLHILDHAILRTCVSFSKKLPYLCFFSFIYELAACY